MEGLMKIALSGIAAVAVLLVIGFSSTAAAQTNELVVTVTGTVLSGDDTDSSGILGYGISPTPSAPGGTAVGLPVTITFVLNLNEIPTNYGSLPPPVGFGNPNRAYYWTNTLPGSDWIKATDVIGAYTVPELAPGGGNFGSSTFAQLWTAYGSLPVYNEFDVESNQTSRTINPLGGGAYQEIFSADSSVLRIDSITTPFLNGLSLNQNFTWNPSENDGASTGEIERNITVATCTASECVYTDTLLSAAVDIQIDSVTAHRVPEPSPLGLLGLSLAGVGLSRRRRRKQQAHS
jgi:hypothetical protein